jgi:hypothetical protein
MPHPGLKVTNRKDFNGRLEGCFCSLLHRSVSNVALDIESDFKVQLQALIPAVFQPDNEHFLKRINDEHVTSSQLFEYFRVSRIHDWLDAMFFFRLTVLCSLREIFHRRRLCLKYVSRVSMPLAKSLSLDRRPPMPTI